MLKAIIFDVDGTLAETERDVHRVAFNRAFRKHGLDWHWDRVGYGRLLSTAGGRERIERFLSESATAVPDPAGFSRAVHATKTACYLEILAAGAIALRPGVGRLMAAARASGVGLAIATTSAPEAVRALLHSTLGADAESWFRVIAAGDSVARKKPAPDVYRQVLEALSLDPREAVAIEDSAHGVAAARAAGLAVLGTVSAYTRPDELAAATAVVDHLGEPDQPCRLLAGSPDPDGCVTLDTLGMLIAHQHDD